MLDKICCICSLPKNIMEYCKNKNRPDGHSDQCKSCAKIYRDQHKQDKLSYPSSTLEYKKKYRQDNKERANALRRQDRQNNPEKYKLLSQVRYIKDKDKIREQQRLFYQNNKDYFSKKNKRYREEHREYILLKNRKRKKLIQGQHISPQEIAHLMKLFDYNCYYCKIKLISGINLHMDHKIPLSRGGKHHIDNIVPACKQCNLTKGSKTDSEFLRTLE